MNNNYCVKNSNLVDCITGEEANTPELVKRVLLLFNKVMVNEFHDTPLVINSELLRRIEFFFNFLNVDSIGKIYDIVKQIENAVKDMGYKR